MVIYDPNSNQHSDGRDSIAENDKEQLKENLIDEVISHIKTDIEDGDVTALFELLSFLPTKYLIGYLPEEMWPTFESLNNKNKQQ